MLRDQIIDIIMVHANTEKYMEIVSCKNVAPNIKISFFGKLLFMLSERKIFNVPSVIPYIGKIDCSKEESVPAHVVISVYKLINGTNRKFADDSWLTPFPLSNKMYVEH